jgi:prepilin-type processing-associated H-X9-DG protein
MNVFLARKACRCTGFTVLEFLVCLALVAVIGGILSILLAPRRQQVVMQTTLQQRLPALPRPTGMSCQSNLQKIGVALAQYAQDNDDLYPSLTPSMHDLRLPSEQGYWAQRIAPYLETNWIFSCPSNPHNTTQMGFFPVLKEIPVSYAANPRIIDTQQLRSDKKIRLVDITVPSHKILVAESLHRDPSLGGYESISGRSFQERLFAGHLGQSNYLFADGHVKSLKPMQTARPKNLWGEFVENKGAYGCNASGINCDISPPGLIKQLELVEKRYGANTSTSSRP